MANTILPKDQNGYSIPAMAVSTAVAKITLAAGSVSVAIPVDADGLIPDCVRLAASGNCYFRFGGVAVVAAVTDSLFPVGVETLAVPRGAAYIAVIQDTGATGVFTITKLT